MHVEPQLIFSIDFDDRIAWEVEQKGFVEHVRIELPDKRVATVCFWDPTRLAQDLDNDIKRGQACIGEPGLIVIPRVTVENMKAAVNELYTNGYFERLAGAVSSKNA